MGIRAAQLSLLPIAGFAAMLCLALLASPAAAQGTPEQRAACENDAMRLCGEFVPDVDRITACMQRKRAYLTPRCRAVFGKRR
jgi:hypothetical protein